MTTSDLTVYGRPVGSAWDRRAGGRFTLTEIVDNGGLGLWVTLLREDRDEQRTMSVSQLGRDFVCVPEKAEPAGDEVPLDGMYDKYRVERIHPTPKHRDCRYFVLDAAHDPFAHGTLLDYADRCEASKPNLARDVRALAGIPPIVYDTEPHHRTAEDVTCGAHKWSDEGERCSLPAGHKVGHSWQRPAVPEPIEPSGVAPVEWAHKVFFGDLIHIGEPLYRVVDADGKAILEPEPAPTPPPPWQLPNAAPYWRNVDGGVVLTRHMDTARISELWVGGYFIPADLIGRLRVDYLTVTAQAILDAVDGVS